MVILKSKKTW